MADIVALKPHHHKTDNRETRTGCAGFKLLFFTGVRYERMTEKQDLNKAAAPATPRKSRRKA